MSSHAQIRPQGAEKQLRKVVVGGGWVVVGVCPKTITAPAQKQIRSAKLVNKSDIQEAQTSRNAHFTVGRFLSCFNIGKLI